MEITFPTRFRAGDVLSPENAFVLDALAVEHVLARDYGLRDLPASWLAHSIDKWQKEAASRQRVHTVASLAFLVANEWQRGLTVPAATQ